MGGMRFLRYWILIVSISISGCATVQAVVESLAHPRSWAMQLDPARTYRNHDLRPRPDERRFHECTNVGVTQAYFVSEVGEWGKNTLLILANATVEVAGTSRELIVPTRADTLQLRVVDVQCAGRNAVSFTMASGDATVRHAAAVNYKAELDRIRMRPFSEIPSRLFLAASVESRNLRILDGDEFVLPTALVSCEVDHYHRLQCAPTAVGRSSEIRELATALQEEHSRRVAEAARQREEQQRAAAAEREAQRNALRNAGPPAIVLESVCTQATLSGPEFPESSALSGDARQILILQPEGSSTAQLRRLVTANAGACVFAEGTTHMPQMKTLEYAPLQMDFTTDVRKYRIQFFEGQFKEFAAWHYVASCVPNARVVVSGEFRGLQQYSSSEYIVALQPARVIALQDWERSTILPIDEWTAKSLDDLDQEFRQCWARTRNR